MDPEFLALGVAWYAVFVVSTSLHEAAHAWAALRMGDPTAYYGGQVSLNPLPHIEREPLGMIVLPIISYLAGGHWMLGWASAPYDPFWASRYPRRAALMALAGPLANLLLAIMAGLFIRIGLAAGIFELPGDFDYPRIVAGVDDGLSAAFAKLVSILFSLNLLLFAFNLIPLPPLDGSAVVGLVLPPTTARHYQETLRQPVYCLIGMVVAWNLAKFVIRPVFRTAFDILFFGV